MESIKSEKIVQQVMEVFRDTHLMDQDAMTLALQLLYWAKISLTEQIEDSLKIQSGNYNYADPEQLVKIWDGLSKISEPLRMAYSNSEILSAIQASCVVEAVSRCAKFAERGDLSTFDPTDCLPLTVGRDLGEIGLPPEIARLMLSIAEIEPEKSVYIPWDDSFQISAGASKQGANVYMETPLRKPILPALISLFVGGTAKVVCGDPVRNPSAIEGGRLTKFDTSLSFPPMNVRYPQDVTGRDLYGRFKESTPSGNVLAVWHIMAQTNGRAVIAVPNSLLFSPGSERTLRDDLLNRKLIEAVIALPSGLLYRTNTPFALIVLNMKEPQNLIRFINAEAEHFRDPIPKARAKLIGIEGIVARANGSLADEYVVEVKTEDVIKNDATFQVNRYVIPESTQKIKNFMENSETKRLRDLVKMIRPMRLTNLEGGLRVLEVGAADLQEFGYITPPIKEVTIDIDIYPQSVPQFLLPFDIIIIVKGSVGKVGIVPEETPPPGEGGWIVGQSAVILRVIKPDVMPPKALAVYLRSPLCQELIRGLPVGASIPLIRNNDLLDFPVIIPPLEDVAEICTIIDKQASLQKEIEKLKKQQAELSKQMWTLE